MLVCDVDGTLSFDGVSIAPEIVRALLTVSIDHQLVLASARPLRDLLPIVPAQLASAWLVGANGALRRGPDGITSDHLDDGARARLDAVIARFELAALIDGEWDYSYTGDGTDAVIRKVDRSAARNVPARDLEVYTKAVVLDPSADAVAALRDLGLGLVVHSDEAAVDISPPGIDKAHGVARLAHGARGYVAFGNDANDAPLFRHARRSYCVGDHPVGRGATIVVDPSTVATAVLDAGRWMTSSGW